MLVISPNLQVEALIPKVRVFWRLALWEEIVFKQGPEKGAPMMRLVAEKTRALCLHHVRTQQTRKRVFTKAHADWHLNLGLPTYRTGTN